MSIEYRKQKIQESIAKYPALAIGLTEEQLNDGGIIHFSGLTEHQKQACRLAGKLCDWHPQNVAEICPLNRPPLFEETGNPYTPGEWDKKCQAWQKEHDTPVGELAQSYADEMQSYTVWRSLEPIEWHPDGVRISAHDNAVGKMPVPVAEW